MSRPRPIEILLVEDNEPDYELTRKAFTDEFVTNFARVADGEAALAYLRKQREFESVSTPDVVLLDINLPGMSGLEVLEEIRNDPALKRMAVVMLTVSDDPNDIRDAYDLHANCFITKPVNVDQFMTAMRVFKDFWLRFAQPPIG